MRIAVMGAGSVGGYFGSKLAASGHEVAFIARGKHLEAMRQEGLKIQSFQGDLSVRALFTSDPAEIGPVELILFSVKSYDTEAAAKLLGPLMGEKSAILSLQNGVDNPDKIANLWGQQRTLAGVAYIGARVFSPGVIEHSAAGRIVLGAVSGGESNKAEEVQRLFSEAQVPCAASPMIRNVLWEKLAWNAPFCAIACLTRATVKKILQSDSLRKLAIDCMEEVKEAAHCQSLVLAPTLVADTLRLSENLGEFKPSMLQDLEAGKPLEHEAFNGIVVNLLRQAGKQAPINQIFYGALKYLDKKIRREV